MTDHAHLRLVLQQEGPYAFRIDFAGTDLAALHSDEPPPLGEGVDRIRRRCCWRASPTA